MHEGANEASKLGQFSCCTVIRLPGSLQCMNQVYLHASDKTDHIGPAGMGIGGEALYSHLLRAKSYLRTGELGTELATYFT
jgi:hypothetical protein